MDIRQLRSFLAVVDHGSFSSAAEVLFTVQSNVSAHVGRLETEIGTALIDRRTRELTPAGLVVERRGREILRNLSAIGDDLAAIENRIIGEVVCGTTPSIGLRIVPPALSRATRELPEVSVSVVEAHSGTLVQQLLSGDLDLAITTSAAASTRDLESRPLFTEDIVVVLAEDHSYAAKHQLTIRDLAQTTLLLPLQDNPLYGHIASAFSKASLPLYAGFEVGSSALVQAMAAAQVGVALVPASAAIDGAAAHTVVRPIERMPPRQVTLATRSATQPSRAVQAMTTLLAETARQAASTMPGCKVIDASQT